MIQKILKLSLILAVVSIGIVSIGRAVAVSAPNLSGPAGLSIIEIKITGNEFIMLQNNTGATIPDLSLFWLYGFNNINPLAADTTSSSQQLPSGSLDNGQTLLLSGNGGATCGAAVTAKLSISLGDAGGYLAVVKTGMNNNVLTQTAGDVVSWSSSLNSAPGMISKVPSNTADPGGAWYRYKNSVSAPPYLWQAAELDAKNSCQLNVIVSGTSVPGPSNPGNQLLPGLPPPATILSITSAVTGSKLPLTDAGLRSPQLTELLPNPASPQTDANDEFIEIYNSNNAKFDLSGFKLQTASGLTSTRHTYTFPEGSAIAADSFAAYPSANISISLTNGGGLVWLLDPNGAVISQTEPYAEAKDGLAWALANGKWYWTSKPTPASANIIRGTAAKQPVTGKADGKVKGASTTIAGTSSANTANGNNPDQSKSVNSAVLVGVGGLAVVYGLYEYRRDLANWFHKFKRNRAVRRENRPKS